MMSIFSRHLSSFANANHRFKTKTQRRAGRLWTRSIHFNHVLQAVLTVCVFCTGHGLAQKAEVKGEPIGPSGPALSGTVTSRPQFPEQAQQNVAAVTGVPDESVRYRMFFTLMATFEQVADKLEKDGKPEDAKAWRSHVQRAAGLNEHEGGLLKATALDCNKALADKDAELQAFATQLGSQTRQTTLDTSDGLSANPTYTRMVQEKQQVLDTHLDLVKSQLGADRFEKLDSYVRDLFKNSVTVPVSNKMAVKPASDGSKQ